MLQAIQYSTQQKKLKLLMAITGGVQISSNFSIQRTGAEEMKKVKDGNIRAVVECLLIFLKFARFFRLSQLE